MNWKKVDISWINTKNIQYVIGNRFTCLYVSLSTSVWPRISCTCLLEITEACLQHRHPECVCMSLLCWRTCVRHRLVYRAVSCVFHCFSSATSSSLLLYTWPISRSLFKFASPIRAVCMDCLLRKQKTLPDPLNCKILIFSWFTSWSTSRNVN